MVHRLSALRKSLATMEELDLTSAPIDDYENDSGDECGSSCDEDHEHVHGDEDEDESEEEEEMLASEMWDLNGAAELSEDEDAEMLARMDGEDSEEDDEDDDELEDDEEMMDEDGYDSEAEAEMEENLMQMTHDELELLKEDMAGDEDAEMLIATVNRVQRRKAGLPSDDDESDDELAPAPVSTKKAGKRQLAPAVIPTLAPLASSSKLAKARRPAASAVNDDFVDPQTLSRTDASDKANKKHSLRFHVSQVNQRQHKRENANAARIGGDDDLPRRSKERSRREVLKRQEHGGQAGEALDGADWDETDRAMAAAVKGKAAEVNGDGDDDGDYYDLVKMSKGEERAAKKAKYDDERMAERDEIMALASGEAGVGPRAASKMIIKNKGKQVARLGDGSDVLTDLFPVLRRTDAAAEEGEPQQPCQEAAAVRQGAEEGRLDEADLQGARRGGQLLGRDQRHQLQERQGYQAGKVDRSFVRACLCLLQRALVVAQFDW